MIKRKEFKFTQHGDADTQFKEAIDFANSLPTDSVLNICEYNIPRRFMTSYAAGLRQRLIASDHKIVVWYKE